MDAEKDAFAPDLIGACGLYCGACENYLAFKPSHEHLLDKEKFCENKEKEYCEGCGSSRVSAHCGACPMRSCAQGRGLRSCARCPEHPCEAVLDFARGAEKWSGAKHRSAVLDNAASLAEIGEESWLRAQAQRWTCGCGTAFSYYERSCIDCGSGLDSFC